jgi:hypothetical protein
MLAQPAFEGTWEEILTHSQELAGHRVRLFVVSEDDEPYPGVPADQRPSTGASLLKYAGTWVGDDLEECLQAVYDARLPAKF